MKAYGFIPLRPGQADRQLLFRIMDMIESLAAGERRGRKIDVRQGYLKYPVGKHHVYFRRSDSGIEVVRIPHQSMDVNPILLL